MNPEGLLNKIITGDENALRQLFEQYSQRLYHVAYYYLQAKEPAEEAVLDVFTTVWKKRESLGHIKTIEQYLYTSTKNQALHYPVSYTHLLFRDDTVLLLHFPNST